MGALIRLHFSLLMALVYGELMVSLNKFEDFDAWFNELAPSFDEQEFTASEFIQ
ncbi:hypothetical protein OH492_08005 [Vibrio chagasii]|nr:hypothetical protein [Vibrio chagasii]